MIIALDSGIGGASILKEVIENSFNNEFVYFADTMNSPYGNKSKKQIYEKVWEENYCGDDNTLLVHLSHLREKIEDSPKSPKYLKTIRGIGYKFEMVK